MTTEPLKLIRKKNSKTYEAHRKDKENKELRDEFKKQSSIIKKEIQKAQKNQVGPTILTELLNQNLKNSKKYWETINEVRGFKKDSQITQIMIDEEKVLVSEDPKRVN